MGATYAAETGAGFVPDEALANMLAEWVKDPDWPDPYDKGYVQVWDSPVGPEAVEWMIGWTRNNPPEGVDPDDKWGPWMAFPLAAGGWCFHGWVNT
jgi:hypothetical protein